jgi:hypothetical protein
MLCKVRKMVQSEMLLALLLSPNEPLSVFAFDRLPLVVGKFADCHLPAARATLLSFPSRRHFIQLLAHGVACPTEDRHPLVDEQYR